MLAQDGTIRQAVLKVETMMKSLKVEWFGSGESVFSARLKSRVRSPPASCRRGGGERGVICRMQII